MLILFMDLHRIYGQQKASRSHVGDNRTAVCDDTFETLPLARVI